MVDNFTVAAVSEPAAPTPIREDEKVEVLIKEVVRIRPKDFEAFKHSLEDFVNNWA